MGIYNTFSLWIKMIIFTIPAAFAAGIVIAWIMKHPETVVLCLFGVWVIYFGWKESTELY